MASNNINDGNLHVKGRLTCELMTIPDETVDDDAVAADADIDADKLEHRHLKGHSQPNTTATAETRTIHVARGSGTLEEFVAGSIAKAVGDSTVTIDLKKNGSSILTAPITLNSSNTNRVAATQTISSAAYVAGDWFEIVITISAGTGTLPTGVYGQGTFHELT